MSCNREPKARQELQMPSKESYTRQLKVAQRDLITCKLKKSKRLVFSFAMCNSLKKCKLKYSIKKIEQISFTKPPSGPPPLFFIFALE